MSLPSRDSIAFAAIAAILLLASAPPAHAYRPFDGTDAAVAPSQKIEVEFGPLGYIREGSERLIVFPSLGLSYGAGSGWEFVAEGRRLMQMSDAEPTPEPIYDDFEIAVKRLLRKGILQDEKGSSIATEGAVLLPTSEEKGTGFSGALVLSQHFHYVGVHLNAEISRTRTYETGRFGSVILEVFDKLTIHPVFELSLEREGENTTSQGLLVGALWETREGLMLDFGVRSAYADEHEAEARVGITFNKHVSHGWRMP